MVHWFILRLMQCLLSSLKYIVETEFVCANNVRDRVPILKTQCSTCVFEEEVEVSYDDVDVVMKRLGITVDDKHQNSSITKEVNVLLEEKVASVKELKEAFEVFDNNGDGYITTNELWVLLQKLGVSAEMRYEDCDKMIRVYDMDGDGRISFNEFKNMMENAE